jgi:hypothetical protein
MISQASSGRPSRDEESSALVERWCAFGPSLRTFQGDFDDYLAGLMGRNFIQDLLKGSSRNVAVHLSRATAAGDAAYRRHTAPDDGDLLLRHAPWDVNQWWWKRVPPSGPVLDWLRSGEQTGLVVPGRWSY